MNQFGVFQLLNFENLLRKCKSIEMNLASDLFTEIESFMNTLTEKNTLFKNLLDIGEIILKEKKNKDKNFPFQRTKECCKTNIFFFKYKKNKVSL